MKRRLRSDAPPIPDFRDPACLEEHILQIMAFYDPVCVDPTGGFFQNFLDDGTVFDASLRHLVSSTRFVVIHAWAARHFPDHPTAATWLERTRHGLTFLESAHRHPAHGGYRWMLRFEQGTVTPIDDTQHAYGLAFVLLAQAEALRAGVGEAQVALRATIAMLDERFLDAGTGLYADEISPDGVLSTYRGQNANMHACEAFLAAFHATGDRALLERARVLAQGVTADLAAMAGGLIWEHYTAQADGTWTPDWTYNQGNRSNIFRPWGYQTGHFTEWAKLLLLIEREYPDLPDLPEDNPIVTRARDLFAEATRHGWDRAHGGLAYGFAPETGGPDAGPLRICDGDKYFWVQAESLAAAAVLAERTREGAYWDWYDRIWLYCWQHFVDHTHGAWYRQLTPENQKTSDEKSPIGKTDYHTLGACYEALAALKR